MAEAFKKYQSFDFSKCNEWQTYYTNLFPIPPTNKVDRFKRKWYKNNIDQSFDIDYKEQETKQQQQYEEPPKPQPYKNNSLYTLENLLKIAVFPCSVLAEPYIVKICIVISSVLAVIRNKGMIKFSKEYLALVITSEFFHNIIFTISIPHAQYEFKNIIRSITPGPLKVVVEKLIMGYEKLLNLLTPSQ
ncbi:hypothetical protein IMG5_198730 [Ichthyophthirius multifiliis]|uniref:Uncharacterized protein n=1 Tax=Ichthyophthirius multifiliis TaxID=5932 RepID=G0R5G0_ICHMU|nr:hypothetical protein IMG5_198730 [Ichthyophthirius multifiliis]EGR27282.1 hypothetical protein IMG5_198730 [Ichthyophthirius multifiliis]|eukprot:XP_004024166.1 hypothetical protein IMG5_198730 [Ichthyophthirius multifiliis]